MKKIMIGSILLFFCVVFMGCPGVDPINTTTTTAFLPDMTCKTIYDRPPCIDGRFLEVCVCYDRFQQRPDLSCCGFKARGEMFYCVLCDPSNPLYPNCDSALFDAVFHCYNDGTLCGDGIINDKDGIIDPELVKEITDEILEDLEDHLEEQIE